MKMMFKLLSVAVIAAVLFTSCSKDDILFAGTYRGSVSHHSGSTNISTSNGSVFVTKVGDRYDFNFSDGIPTIHNVTLTQGSSGYVGTVNGYTGSISIDDHNLDINVVETATNKTWGADCSR